MAKMKKDNLRLPPPPQSLKNINKHGGCCRQDSAH